MPYTGNGANGAANAICGVDIEDVIQKASTHKRDMLIHLKKMLLNNSLLNYQIFSAFSSFVHKNVNVLESR